MLANAVVLDAWTMYEFAMDKRLTAMVPSEGMQSGMACPTSLGKATGGLIVCKCRILVHYFVSLSL